MIHWKQIIHFGVRDGEEEEWMYQYISRWVSATAESKISTFVFMELMDAGMILFSFRANWKQKWIDKLKAFKSFLHFNETTKTSQRSNYSIIMNFMLALVNWVVYWLWWQVWLSKLLSVNDWPCLTLSLSSWTDSKMYLYIEHIPLPTCSPIFATLLLLIIIIILLLAKHGFIFFKQLWRCLKKKRELKSVV